MGEPVLRCVKRVEASGVMGHRALGTVRSRSGQLLIFRAAMGHCSASHFGIRN